ncbi:MAG: S-methyl-5-thioribose-1-phosphate isomerase [Pseudomonadaceae bacterium]|nr:MAG: S-methyl-5-thioribose-1-phosphate isomerase [Pseudomonadaceae bacterium]
MAVEPAVLREQFQALAWSTDGLRLLDQRQLPGSESYLLCRSAQEVADAINNMSVRGAPAIGIAAAYGIALAAQELGSSDDWAAALEPSFTLLEGTRPTAVNLAWALRMMQQQLQRLPADSDVPAALLAFARQIHDSDREANLTMGRLGAQQLRKYDKRPQHVVTHCNAGALATGGFGTALGVIRTAHAAGLIEKVHANETRPWLQGSRLTAWELVREGIPVSLQADLAVGHLMKEQSVSWVIVGADRIAANGDVVNKIGTYSLAVLAMHHGVRFMVVAPSSTIDMQLENGDLIPLEERDADELLIVGNRQLDTGADVFNPVFDVTPADLIDVIVTEKGIIERPDARKLADLMSRQRLH